MSEHPRPEDDTATGGLPSQQDEFDVEGHKKTAAAEPSVTADAATFRVQGDEDDVEGHIRLGAEPGFVRDKAAFRVQDDEDDVEGHKKI